jgi:hypothetical protein
MIYLLIYYCCVCWVAGALLKEGDVLYSWVEVVFSPCLFPYKVAEVVIYQIKSVYDRGL